MAESERSDRSTLLRTVLFYGVMLFGAAALIAFVERQGRGLTAPAPVDKVLFGSARPGDRIEVLVHVLLALVVIIILARMLGALFKRFNQPPVIGEVVAGIVLGPSVLGRLFPDAQAFLLPPSIAPFLGILSQVGVILYMFLVGLELNPALLRKKTHTAVAVSHASIVFPFLLGAGLALWLYPRYSTQDVPFFVFCLFSGVSMSVTAFPVLARILTDRGIQKTRLGSIALACAAVDDVTAWCLLAFVVSVVHARVGGAFLTMGLTVAYIAAMLVLVRPALKRVVAWYERTGQPSRNVTAGVLLALLVSSLITELIGIHALFGAFLLGAAIDPDSKLTRDLTGKLEDIVLLLFLPAFFAFTGMRTQIGLVQGWASWLAVVVIIAVASLGKFGGSFVAARLTGMKPRDAAVIGILMNTRGLMELIVLNIGLDLRVLSPTLFAMLVLMALVTTLFTTPVLNRLTRGVSLELDPAR